MMHLRPAWWQALTALLLAASMQLGGCVSQILPVDEWANGAIGQPVQVLIDLVKRPRDPKRDPTAGFLWKPKAYTLPNGNSVYLIQERRDCFVHFEVNRKQIIVGYRLEGTTCD